MTCVLAVVAVLLTASEPAVAGHCPLSPQPLSPEPEAAGCFYPEVSVSANPTSVTVNSGTSTISFTVTGADPSQGCSKSGGWSGSIAVDAGGNASGQETVGPFPSTGTINFNAICPADPVEGWAGATVTVTSGGGSQPPPPPPPPSDYDASGPSSAPALAHIASYVNSGGVTIRCWSNASIGGSTQSWGRWPWGRKVIQKVWVCGPTGGHLTDVRVETSFTTDSFCRLGPGGKTTTRVSGGVGYSTVRFLSRAYFECDLLWPLD